MIFPPLPPFPLPVISSGRQSPFQHVGALLPSVPVPLLEAVKKEIDAEKRYVAKLMVSLINLHLSL